MPNATRFRQNSLPRQPGELMRLKVIQGPDYGAIFVVTGARATVGRGETCDVMISDLKSSRQHAEFIAVPGGWKVRDLGSANGILLNGNEAKIADVRTGNTVTIGETVLEFMAASDSNTLMLKAPAKSPAQMKADQAALDAHRQRIRAMTSFGGGEAMKAAVARPNLNPAGQRRLLIYGALGALLYFLVGTEGEQVQKRKKRTTSVEARDLASLLPPDDSPEVNKTATMFFKAGFKEYQAGNYLRAKVQFETALQVSPGHKLSNLYLQNCDKAIQEEVKFHLDRGLKGYESGKLRESKGHYEAILRLLYRDQASPYYIEAKDQLVKVSKAIKGDT
ncbi:MAG: FHA domain-containing protein [Bacteriovoracia bacterium]